MVVCSFEIAAGLAYQAINISPVFLTGIVRLTETFVILYYTFRTDGHFRSLGCEKKQILPGIYHGCLWSLCFGVIVFTIFFSWHLILNINLFRLIRMPVPDTIIAQIMYFCVGCIIGPLTEELVFRGVVYGFFRQWGIAMACFWSTIIFVLLHNNAPALPITQIIGGLVFAFSYEYSKMLATPLTIHVLGNSCMAFLSYLPITG
ncbi:MAG: abortive infection protein [Candidatus Magnetoglobus multicellularis str. Araruama]|uniref:Abortive infection protein n=1 Tax=Candidatus Magnetoglobus multicellularis str. Araruama TaxID=890399 RepID=A0A1V1PGP0_9BACT|nr:MAG: abortive infection protein [Candidatus Magnetoglobus multicellularis str. Araruama]